jgi:hypothetical protein
MQLMQQRQRLAALLGLQKRQRPVEDDLSSWLAQTGDEGDGDNGPRTKSFTTSSTAR